MNYCKCKSTRSYRCTECGLTEEDNKPTPEQLAEWIREHAKESKCYWEEAEHICNASIKDLAKYLWEKMESK